MEKKLVIEGPCVNVGKAYPECSVADKCCYIPLVEIETKREMISPEEAAEYKAEAEAENRTLQAGWDEFIEGAEFACEDFEFTPGKKYRITIEEID